MHGSSTNSFHGIIACRKDNFATSGNFKIDFTFAEHLKQVNQNTSF
jgi:hypothetical protein